MLTGNLVFFAAVVAAFTNAGYKQDMADTFRVVPSALREGEAAFHGLSRALGEQAVAVPGALLGAAGSAGDGGLVAALEGATSSAEQILTAYENHVGDIASRLVSTAESYERADSTAGGRMRAQ